MYDLERLGRGRQHTIAQALGVPLDDAQRGSQVVGDIGRHLATQLVGPRQVRAHLIERGGQFPQFILGADGYLLREFAFGHSSSGGSQFAHGAREPTGQKNAQEQGDQGGRQGGVQRGSIRARQVLRFPPIKRRGISCDQRGPHDLAVHFNFDALGQLVSRNAVAEAIRPGWQYHVAILVCHGKHVGSRLLHRAVSVLRLWRWQQQLLAWSGLWRWRRCQSVEILPHPQPRSVRLIIGRRVCQEVVLRLLQHQAVKLLERGPPGKEGGQHRTGDAHDQEGKY